MNKWAGGQVGLEKEYRVVRLFSETAGKKSGFGRTSYSTGYSVKQKGLSFSEK